MSKAQIYALLDPRTDEVRYIGKTEIGVRYRLQTHCVPGDKTHKGRWIDSLLRLGLRPRLQVLMEVPAAEWEAWECSWIAVGRELGWPLTNHTDGGERGPRGQTWTLSDLTRRRISEGRRAYYERLRVTTGIPPSPLIGRTHSQETKDKISAARTGRPGTPHTEEFKAQLAERNRSRVWTDESRRKASESKKRAAEARRLQAGGGQE